MNILTIGGSDPSTGAGIQNDVKTITLWGAYPLTVITAITSQNTSKFEKVEPVSAKMIKSQIEAVFSDFQIDAIKIGMVYNSKIIGIIYKKLKNVHVPIVLDPVIKSTTGGTLIEKSSVSYLKKYLIPITTVITPNKIEAEKIAGMKINSKHSLNVAAKKIHQMGAKYVVITGYEFKRKVIDILYDGKNTYEIAGRKIPTINHGSGCTYSSSIAFLLSNGKSIYESIKISKKFTSNAIMNSQKIGKGILITKVKTQNDEEIRLSNAIQALKEIRNISKKIPECQTNFVFAKNNPKSPKDVLGILGRIVKIGNTITQCGRIEYGASKHVATAVIEINKKFPTIRSAINLKYDEKTISKFRRLGLIIRSYDRRAEPRSNKMKGSSVAWGIKSILKETKVCPDLIYHRGDFGKEPMILLFAETPQKIIEKISKIS